MGAGQVTLASCEQSSCPASVGHGVPACRPLERAERRFQENVLESLLLPEGAEMKRFIATLVASCLAVPMVSAQQPAPKPAEAAVAARNRAVLDELPFADRDDFD